MSEFARRLLRWYRLHGRHDLPWKAGRDPYRIWVSEIMLQQTQVATAIPYFMRFMARFPDLSSLAHASQDAVLELWSGLGYYARGRNLHRAALIILNEHGGVMPEEREQLMELPGIGRSTAGAILALAHDQPLPILDGNVKRVLCRVHAIRSWPGEARIQARLWRLAAELVPARRAAEYTQAIMDLGAGVCTRSKPRCDACPVERLCLARARGIERKLPVSRTRQAVPLRRKRLLVMRRSSGEIFLERRPPAGIWGGLWSFPECPAGRNVRGFVSERYGFAVDGISAGRSLRHTLSHMELELRPIEVRLGSADFSRSRVADCDHSAWVQPGQKLRLGVAAPVRKMLEAFSA